MDVHEPHPTGVVGQLGKLNHRLHLEDRHRVRVGHSWQASLGNVWPSRGGNVLTVLATKLVECLAVLHYVSHGNSDGSKCAGLLDHSIHVIGQLHWLCCECLFKRANK